MASLTPCGVFTPFIVLVLLFNLTESIKITVKGSMGDRRFCKSVRGETKWLTNQTSAIIFGKSERRMPKDCSIMFGASSKASKNVRLRVSFDFIYFDSCGVKLQINQSSTSDFRNSGDNREMFMSGCNHENPGPLFAKPKHYVLISLNKVNDRLEGYNFRLNISIAEHLPVTGTPLRVVIIVSFVCLVVVVVAAFLLVKYANRLSIKWNEERREEAVTEAIDLFNFRERSDNVEESNMAFFEPGVGLQRKTNRPEIAFVHGDGRMEVFQPLINQQEVNVPERVPQSNHRQSSTPGEEPTHFFLSFVQDRQNPLNSLTALELTSSTCDVVETASVGGVELPPSYEEALGMPLPLSVSCDVGDGNVVDAGDCNEGAVGGGDAIAGDGDSNTGKNTNEECVNCDLGLLNQGEVGNSISNVQDDRQLLDTSTTVESEIETEVRTLNGVHPVKSDQN